MKRSLSNIPVNLIRQWCYCPRVVYYRELTGMKTNYPPWVKQGEEFHKSEEKLWQRRNLSRFHLESGEKHYSMYLRDEEIGLHGIVDMAVETHTAVFAVEFKLSASNKKRGDILQLSAYAILLQKKFAKPSPNGFLVGKGKVLHSIDITEELQNGVFVIADRIRKMLLRGTKPDSSATIQQCCNCEYINYCNDRC